jgi:hypothetical protein
VFELRSTELDLESTGHERNSGKLLADSIVLDSRPDGPSVSRFTVGGAVDLPFSRWMGASRTATDGGDVRELWDELLKREARCGDILHGGPSTVLSIQDAVVSKDESGGLRVSGASAPHQSATPSGSVALAIPRFTFAITDRKRRNFGHWLLDCLPQVVALAAIEPHARILLPSPLRGFQRSTLSLLGVGPDRIVEWDERPMAAERLLVYESDGRAGGGRPLSALTEMRRLLTPSRVPAAKPWRKIYVSRRDASRKRRWVSNVRELDALFTRCGFEVVVMSECPLDEQIRLFSEASIVAGVSGAGLSDIIFTPPGAHVLVLLSDSLIRWYADARGQRSAWTRADDAPLAALGDSPRFYAHLAAACEQYCHCFLGSDHMPLTALEAFVGNVIAGVETGGG